MGEFNESLEDPNNLFDSDLSVATYDLFAASASGWGTVAGDLQFYVDCARSYGTPVLEIGTGTGRIALPLAQNGFEVVGIDKSPKMLAIAAKKMASSGLVSVSFVEADMVNFSLERTFPLVIIPARAFHHLTTPQAQRLALGCIRKHLGEGGHVVLDLFDPRLEFCLTAAPSPMPMKEMLDQETGRRFRRTTIAHRNNPYRQLIGEDVLFEELGPMDTIIARHEASYTLRWMLRQEMIYLLEACGFSVVGQYGNFSYAPPSYGAEQIWIARRAS
jgi:ubiquinone/menaquinone biosynthesis C-methylase UbiE